MARNFTSVPILDWNLIITGNKDHFLEQLRAAIINVGFLYLANPPVSKDLVESVVCYVPRLFALDQTEKDKIAMVNSQHFLGYSKLGSELTRGAVDLREQFDFATPNQCRWKPGAPDFWRLWGTAQWPPEESLPGFKKVFLEYLAAIEALSHKFTSLLAESLLLPPDAFDPYFDSPKSIMQHRGKIVKYPPVGTIEGNQGVGPHFDAGFLTFLLQASPHKGLQVQNLSGEWIDVPPIENTLVVNLGKGLEIVTKKVALATSHRVLSPLPGSTPRYSIPFFQNISQQCRLSDVDLNFSEEILMMKQARGVAGPTDSVNFSEYANGDVSGHVTLLGRIKSHPNVAERHYPQLFKLVFPNGRPQLGSAY